jgi:hypothetical protein
MSVISHPLYVKAIKVEFAFNEEILEKIRKNKHTLNYAAWDKELKSWIFSLDERSITFLATLVSQYEFTTDTEVNNYLNQCNEIQCSFEQYVPVVMHDTAFRFNNVSPAVPQPSSDDLLTTLFEARQVGIHTWEEKIETLLTQHNVSTVVKDFLRSNPADPFSVNTEDYPLLSLKDVVKYLLPCLVVIPGGSELEKLTTSFEFLKAIGISNQEISVLFRLPSSIKSEFNQYVKDNNLNNIVDEHTKVVFISSKVPKTLLDPVKEFNCVMNFNFYSIHYTIRDYLKWHKNVIYISEKKQQRTFDFGNV